jgi:hypothetical protein
MLDPRQGRQSIAQVLIKILCAQWFITSQAGVDLEKKTSARFEAGIDRGSFARAANEQGGRGQKRK